MNVTCRENLKGCNLYKWKPLEYQTKWDYVKEETIYRGLEGLPLSLRESIILLLLLIAVYDFWKIMMIKFSIDQSVFVYHNFLPLREKVQNQEYFSNCSNL